MGIFDDDDSGGSIGVGQLVTIVGGREDHKWKVLQLDGDRAELQMDGFSSATMRKWAELGDLRVLL